jgi:hypothetical protein
VVTETLRDIRAGTITVNIEPVETGERRLVALAAALGAVEVGGPLTRAEAGLLEAACDVCIAPVEVDAIRRAITDGDDPLGALFKSDASLAVTRLKRKVVGWSRRVRAPRGPLKEVRGQTVALTRNRGRLALGNVRHPAKFAGPVAVFALTRHVRWQPVSICIEREFLESCLMTVAVTRLKPMPLEQRSERLHARLGGKVVWPIVPSEG